MTRQKKEHAEYAKDETSCHCNQYDEVFLYFLHLPNGIYAAPPLADAFVLHNLFWLLFPILIGFCVAQTFTNILLVFHHAISNYCAFCILRHTRARAYARARTHTRTNSLSLSPTFPLFLLPSLSPTLSLSLSISRYLS